MMRGGIRSRIAIFVFVTASLALVLFGVALSKQVLDSHRREFDSEFYNLVLDVSQQVGTIAEDIPTAPEDGFSFGKKSVPFPETLSFFQLRAADGSIVYRSPNLGGKELPWTLADWRTLVNDAVVFTDLPGELVGFGDGTRLRMISVPLKDEDYFHGVLQVAAPTVVIDKERKRLTELFLLMMPLLGLGLAFGSYWISGSALSPLRELIERTRGIAPSDLSVRLPVAFPIAKTGDEIAELSRTLNGMLDRLQTAFQSQERFVADASHQLKTPLAILRGEIELLQRKSNDQKEFSMFLDSAHEEVGHLSKLVEGLLLLARVSALPEASLVRSAVRIDELLTGILERFRTSLDRCSLKCRFQLGSEAVSDLEVMGDEDLLRSLFETLIENAIKYSPDGGVIEVELHPSPGSIQVRVSDQGSGIAPAERERVFERFYRLDTHTHGFGLGLTIARQIALAHGGSIRLEDLAGWGTSIVVELKLTRRGESPPRMH